MQQRPQYINESQQRIFKIQNVLSGHELLGLAPSEIARALGVGNSTITRDLANFKEAGYAEQIAETGRWRLGPKLVQISIKFGDALARAEARVREIPQRYTRTAS